MENSNFEVRNEEAEAALKEIGNLIGGKIPKGFGFALLICSIGDNSNTFYVSNIQRQDMINNFKLFIKRLEKK
jgi:hypothetical protein